MVKSEIDDVTTYYPSAAYQVKTNGSYANTRKYYSFNGAVVAMRENSTLTWLLHTCPGGRCQGDQVNSTTVTANADGSFQSEVRYSAYGEVRHADGTTVTDKLYTGQQQEVEIGLSYYIARFYDPVIAHFIQADSVIPQASASASYDRYACVSGNPTNFSDPTGNIPCVDWNDYGKCIVDTQANKTWSQTSAATKAISPTTSFAPNVPGSSAKGGTSATSTRRTGGNKETKGTGNYPNAPDPTAPLVIIGTSINPSCNSGNLTWCFYNRGLLPTGTYNVSQSQMEELMTAVYYDINNRPYASYLDRVRYDTPFWDWEGVANSIICIEGDCYKGIEVNYLAQGMFSAKYETYDPGLLLVYLWKESQYREPPSSGTMYWYTAGYNFWMDHTFQIEIRYLK